MRASFVKFSVLVVLAAVLLAACSGDDGDGGDASSGAEGGSATTQPAVRHHELSAEEIETYQADLDAVGCWAGPVDGILGPRTEAALREFQEAEGIAVTGLFGGESQGALTAAAQAGQPVCADAEGAETDGSGDGDGRAVDDASVHELEVWQHDLNVVGCWAGAEDGTQGPQTTAAITAFQTAAGLTADGRLGPATEGALADAAAAGTQVCHAAVSATPSTTENPDAEMEPGGGEGSEVRGFMVNSGGVFATAAQAQERVDQIRRAGVPGFNPVQAQSGFVVLRGELTEDQANRILGQLQQAGIAARLSAEV